jgi:2-polyprenyl-3-methyl-5-hydroxy-6-metoxy-1,4-benzoquinol methylase
MLGLMSGDPGRVPAAADWSEVSRHFAAALEGHGVTAATIRTNTDLVPARARILTRVLAAMPGRPSLSGATVLEAGCGFGALASYLAIEHRPASLPAIDVREDYLAAAETAARAAGIPPERLEFRLHDMRDAGALGDRRYDVVIANNALIYLAGAGDMRRALHGFRRILRPGGALVMHHANRWAKREPFTGDPVVHLLPAVVARPLARVTGWRHNHGRIKLLTPPGQLLMLWRAGFTDLSVSALRNERIINGPAAWSSRFFAVSARRPLR